MSVNCRLLVHPEQDPLTGNALQRVRAEIDEPKPGSGDKVLHGARDAHFAWSRSRRDARRNVHRYPGQAITYQLAFARVDARPDLDSKRPHRRSDGLSTTNRPRGAIESGHETVACSVDLDTPMDGQLTSYECVVRLEKVSPGPIAEIGRKLRGSHDVGEHNGRENAVGVGRLMRTGEELLDLVCDRVVVAEEWDVVIARELNESRPRYPLGDRAALSDV
jgi:hypothetical protein